MYSTRPITGWPGSETNRSSAGVPATTHAACASGTSAMTQRLPSPVMVIATISGVTIAPSCSSSSVTTPEIGATYGTRPDARPALREPRRGIRIEPERAQSLVRGIDQVAIADSQRVEVLLLRALEHRRIQREQHLPGLDGLAHRAHRQALRPSPRPAAAPAARGARRTRRNRPCLRDAAASPAPRLRCARRCCSRRPARSVSPGRRRRRTPARSPCPSRPSSALSMCDSGRADAGSTAASNPRGRRGGRPPRASSLSTLTRVMPQIGHWPGASRTTSGCMGHRYFGSMCFTACSTAVSSAADFRGSDAGRRGSIRRVRARAAPRRRSATRAGCRTARVPIVRLRIATLMALLPRGNPLRTAPARDPQPAAGASAWSRARCAAPSTTSSTMARLLR